MSGHLKLVVILTIFLVTLALILGNTLYGGTPAFAMFTPIGMGVLTILVHRMMMNADKISPQPNESRNCDMVFPCLCAIYRI